MVATLFPFAVGPDTALLQRTGGGVIWIAALLAALLPIDRLIMPDRDSGVLDQLALRGMADELIALRSEEHTSELQSLMRISYAVFCLKKKKQLNTYTHSPQEHNNTDTVQKYTISYV